MPMFSLSSSLSVALSALAVGYRRKRSKDDWLMKSAVRLPFASSLDFDEHMLCDIGLSDGVCRRQRDERLD